MLFMTKTSLTFPLLPTSCRGLLGKLVTESEGEVTLKVALIRKRRMNGPITSLPQDLYRPPAMFTVTS